MIRGISFEIPNQYGQHLKHILGNIAINKYWWQMNYTDSFKTTENGVNNLFPNNNFLDGEKLTQIINEPEYYVIFLAIAASRNKLENVVYFKGYEGFLRSDFEILIYIYDCSYVKIYCKSESDLEKIKLTAIKNNYENILFVTDENDSEYFRDFEGY